MFKYTHVYLYIYIQIFLKILEDCVYCEYELEWRLHSFAQRSPFCSPLGCFVADEALTWEIPGVPHPTPVSKTWLQPGIRCHQMGPELVNVYQKTMGNP